MNPGSSISIWFFIGISLLVNGALIFGSGLYELIHPPAFPVVLYQLHASIWWGALLFIAGVFYCVHFNPNRVKARQKTNNRASKDGDFGVEAPTIRRPNRSVPAPALTAVWSCPMAIVAGVDFGTLSVRVSLVDSERGLIASAISEYPLHRKREDPDYATQSHEDHMRGLAAATRQAVKEAGISGDQVEAIALDTTRSSVVPVASDLTPIDDYYLWCDHRAKKEAAEITELAHRQNLEAIQWCGGVYSSEWGFAKLLHWLRHNPDKRARFASAFEHCDLVAATLCGITNPAEVKRSVCAMGHKWLWNPALGGLPPESFLTQVDPLLAGVRSKLEGNYCTSDQIAGRLTPTWAEKLGLRAGIPVPVGAFDAHWDAIGAGAKEGDVVNVVGTSTCIIAYVQKAALIPGVCGVVQG